MCGVCGVFNSESAAIYIHAGLFALQHRGREGAGIATHDGENINIKKGLGLVQTLFSDEKSLEGLEGRIAIGGNRYSTVHKYGPECTQPMTFMFEGDQQIATVHNGNITNFEQLRRELQAEKALFQTNVDSELFGVLINQTEGTTLQEKIKRSFPRLIGAYSIIIMTGNEIIGVRDPWGFRPLKLAKINDTYMLASETSAFDILKDEGTVKLEELGSVKPGGIVTINDSGVSYDSLPNTETHAKCIFEYIYFAKPDSRVNGHDISGIRKNYGAQLAREWPVQDADVVIAVPDSGNSAAIGYAQESGIKFDEGLIRNHHAGRTFIESKNDSRKRSIRRKFNPTRSVVEDKKLVVVDDSIVRGNTTERITKMLYDAGAKEVHIRIASPPITSPCYYGIDFRTHEELLVNRLGITSVEADIHKIEQHLGVDSLRYLSLKGMLEVSPQNDYCTACFTGKYPTQTAF